MSVQARRVTAHAHLTCYRAQILAAASSVVSGVDMGYAGSSGLEPQQFVSNNQPCGYICYGFGEFDGQNSGHDFSGNVSARALFLVLAPNPGTKISRSVRGRVFSCRSCMRPCPKAVTAL